VKEQTLTKTQMVGPSPAHYNPCDVYELGRRDSNPDKQIQSPFWNKPKSTEIYLNAKYRRGFFAKLNPKSGQIYRNASGDIVATKRALMLQAPCPPKINLAGTFPVYRLFVEVIQTCQIDQSLGISGDAGVRFGREILDSQHLMITMYKPVYRVDCQVRSLGRTNPTRRRSAEVSISHYPSVKQNGPKMGEDRQEQEVSQYCRGPA
jgi:hypothetical protein